MKQVYRRDVFSAKGKRIGRVTDVLIASGTTRVVGYVIERPRLGMIVDLKDRYLAFDRTIEDPEGLVVSTESAAWDNAAAKRLGISWDESVIWQGMPVRTVSGKAVGLVRDARFDAVTGEMSAIGLTAGMTADIAVGVRDVPISQVRGFDGEAVVVDDEVARIETDGGVAAAAGKGTAVAKKAAGDAAKSAAKTAAIYGKAAAKVAGDAQVGKKFGGMLRSLKDKVTDAMGEDE